MSILGTPQGMLKRVFLLMLELQLTTEVPSLSFLPFLAPFPIASLPPIAAAWQLLA